jgi:N-acetylglucosamine kinase-like BadF-type ATPase
MDLEQIIRGTKDPARHDSVLKEMAAEELEDVIEELLDEDYSEEEDYYFEFEDED